MSSEANNTRELEPALRYLAAHPDKKIEFIAGKFQVEGGKATLWAWLTKFNGGKKELPVHRIDNALAAAASKPAQAPAPKVAAAVKRRVAREPLSRPAAAAPVPDSPPNKFKWVGKKWRGDGFRHHRAALVRLAKDPGLTLVQACGDIREGIAFAQFKKSWIGSGPHPAATYQALIDYGDAREKSDSAEAPAPTPKSAAPKAPEPAAAAPKAAAPVPASPDGWQEIPPACGGHADYDARYSGTKTKTHRLGFTKRASALLKTQKGFADGKFVRAFWRPKDRQLGLVLAGNGFKLRAGRDSLSFAGQGLPKILGDAAIEFTTMPDVKGFDLVLVAKEAS